MFLQLFQLTVVFSPFPVFAYYSHKRRIRSISYLPRRLTFPGDLRIASVIDRDMVFFLSIATQRRKVRVYVLWWASPNYYFATRRVSVPKTRPRVREMGATRSRVANGLSGELNLLLG